MPDSPSKEKGSSILRALQILEIVANSTQPMTPTEINRTLKLPKPSIHRLCSQLEEEGFLQPRLDGRGLLPGQKLNTLAIAILSNNDFLRTQRHIILQRLSDTLGETCNISIPNGGEMVYFDRVETHWPLRVQLQINDRVPLHCTASGKLFLSELSSIQRSRLLAKIPLNSYTPNTLTSAAALKPELSKISKQGVGLDNEEFFQGMIAVSVPIRDKEGRMYAALAMHAPTARLSIEQALQSVPDMRKAAAELSALMEDDMADFQTEPNENE
ncbi:IclR family transcriptional regulator [Neptunomonas japonica]|uniref:IclR family transcriptional regulator n=1 Tax=Neptunomonas japonica TaxID=417574 RepID=UPI0003F7C4F7|nr:IclR family transcriptional regulator [Neptunomonas japonica]